MGLLHQLHQICLGTEAGVHPLIVQGVVLVDGVGLPDGVEVEAGDPQVLEIVQLFQNAPEVAAVALSVGDGTGRPGVQIRFRGASGSAAEAIWKNLIPHRIGHPGRRRRNVRRIHPRLVEVPNLPGLHLLRRTGSVFSVKPDLLPLAQLKPIAAALVGRRDAAGPQAVGTNPLALRHLHRLAFPVPIAA